MSQKVTRWGEPGGGFRADEENGSRIGLSPSLTLALLVPKMIHPKSSYFGHEASRQSEWIPIFEISAIVAAERITFVLLSHSELCR